MKVSLNAVVECIEFEGELLTHYYNKKTIYILFLLQAFLSLIGNKIIYKSLDKSCYNLAMIFVSKSISNRLYGRFIVSCYYISHLLANFLK